MYGYSGKILRVNLTTQEVNKEPLDEKFARKYVGGQGFGAKILYSEVPEGTDSFEPGNKIIFAVGPLAGSSWPGSSRTCVVSKSPLTGYLGDTDFGGYWGQKFKSAGYDCLVVEGRSEDPVYINIKDEEVKIFSAREIWGKSVAEVDQVLKEKNRFGSTLIIGEAGESLVRYACIVSDLRYIAGRSGIGAVMGSKNLKGIVVTGSNKVTITIRDQEKFDKLKKAFIYDLKNDGSCATLSRFGTWNNLPGVSIEGVMPTKNFQMTTWDQTDKIAAQVLKKKLQVKQKTCYGCPISCRNVVRLDEISREPSVYGGPQYEGVASLGSLLLVDDPYAIARLNHLCNHLGLDVISAGVSIAFLLECLDKGLIKKEDVGFAVSWGEEKGIAELLKAIARREGLGRLLAEGVKRAAAEIGQGSEDFAMHVKGMEVAMHDPRGKKGVGLSYATTHKGADHEESMHDPVLQIEGAMTDFGFKKGIDRKVMKGKAEFVKVTQDYWGTMADCLAVCKFFMIPPRPFSPKRVIDCLNYITGWDLNLEDYLETGERIFNLCRLYNLREGMNPEEEDRLPLRFTEILKEGGSKGQNITPEELKQELKEYYRLRGWINGVPSQKTLKRLGLEF